MLRRSAKLVFLDLFISVSYAQETAPGPRHRRFQIGARHAIFQGMDETKIEKLAVSAMSMGLPEVRSNNPAGTRSRERSAWPSELDQFIAEPSRSMVWDLSCELFRRH
jgi:hypothetical protein